MAWHSDHAETCSVCISFDTWTPAKCHGCERSKPKLLDSNVDAMALWEAVSTQWRGAGMAVIGLDYNALLLIAKIMKIDVTEEVLEKIQVMERWTLEKFHSSMEKHDD